MRVVLLVKSVEGGAGGSAYKLHRGLRRMGVESSVLVRTKTIDDDRVIVAPQSKSVRALTRMMRLAHLGDLDTLPLKRYPHRRDALFSAEWLPDSIAPAIAELRPDVVNLRWIGGLVRIETLSRLRRPIVWTLSDAWPFTGGCYYAQDCDRYTQQCGACPQLNSTNSEDLSRRVWRRKARAWKNIDLTVVTPSRWLADCAGASSLFRNVRIDVIPTGVDTGMYKPTDRCAAREVLDWPRDKRIILFGAWSNEPRKGLQLLLPALQSLIESGWRSKIAFAVFGFARPAGFPDLGIDVRFLGRLTDSVSKRAAYSAANVFVAPSTQENLPNTVLEAIACGTPCVAFGIGGMPDVIEHERNGYLARPFHVDDLARGIAWVLKNDEQHRGLSRRAREKAVREFTLDRYGRRYLELFEELVAKHAARKRASHTIG